VNGKGFTLLEVLVAMGLLGMLLAGVVPVFFSLMAVNTRNEERSGAVAAAQQVLEELRQQDPGTLPDSGSTGPHVVPVDRRAFEVTNWYCLASEYCDDNSRHVLIEVRYGGRTFFSAESVLTQLR
jgi:prepilin-type N-terminal cleavage/methylation domain-containing protein